uniref:Uncharacterized protein n=1 Tax=Physcomitrium patens TaxID=3218 RepID=A0A2K1IFY9_PHYPA|nr:hypothetical protein PHYPA_028776 [Physcomitrium patens]
MTDLASHDNTFFLRLASSQRTHLERCALKHDIKLIKTPSRRGVTVLTDRSYLPVRSRVSRTSLTAAKAGNCMDKADTKLRALISLGPNVTIELT